MTVSEKARESPTSNKPSPLQRDEWDNKNIEDMMQCLGDHVGGGGKSSSLLCKGLEPLGEPVASRARPGQDPQNQTRRKRSSRKNQATVKGKVTKWALEEFQERQSQDRLEENLRLMKQKQVTADPKVTMKIVLQNQGRKARERPATKPKMEKPQGTVFTEEDFCKFQEEYFGSPATK
ncbi:active regulator of SIRT1-like [Dromiciops gliroides]|uniref:active regulator of SIRT1-like n=1 Tax=Dromiciops gliroides TaxID=33562 RepID=UPI001CC80010|nr:active regulator of SIRT1-like [Dromiciops gliroides]